MLLQNTFTWWETRTTFQFWRAPSGRRSTSDDPSICPWSCLAPQSISMRGRQFGKSSPSCGKGWCRVGGGLSWLFSWGPLPTLPLPNLLMKSMASTQIFFRYNFRHHSRVELDKIEKKNIFVTKAVHYDFEDPTRIWKQVNRVLGRMVLKKITVCSCRRLSSYSYKFVRISLTQLARTDVWLYSLRHGSEKASLRLREAS